MEGESTRCFVVVAPDKTPDYIFVDQSPIVNASRPASWFKIQAVLNMFRDHSCDWVLWVDADVLIMNYEIPLESFTPNDSAKEIVFTPDLWRGVNAGVFLIHNSAWTISFLNTWWDMSDYIVQEKSAYSGDNTALGSLVRNRWKWKITDKKLRYRSSVLDIIEHSKSDPKIQLLPSMCSMNS